MSDYEGMFIWYLMKGCFYLLKISLLNVFFDYVTYILSVRFAKDTLKGWVRICNHINPLLNLLIVDLLKKF